MMNKKIIAGVLAMSMLASLTACGNAEESGSSKQTESAVTTDTVPNTTETETDNTSGTSESGTETTSESETTEDTTTEGVTSADVENTITAEEAQTIADNGMKALRENDAESMLLYTTVPLFARTSEPDLTDDDIIKSIQEGAENGDTVVPEYEEPETAFSFSLTNPVPITEAELEKLSNFMDEMKEMDGNEDAVYPEITGGYRFAPDYTDSELPEDMQDKEGYMYVLCIDGEYRLDPCFTVMMELMGAFNEGMEEIDGEETTESGEELTEEVTSTAADSADVEEITSVADSAQ